MLLPGQEEGEGVSVCAYCNLEECEMGLRESSACQAGLEEQAQETETIQYDHCT